MLLQITDGATTVQLSQTSPVVGCVYFPLPGDMSDLAAPVTEPVTVVLSGTVDAIRTTARAIGQLLWSAKERYEAGVGPRIFIQYRPVDTDPLWRAELQMGELRWSDDKKLRNLASVAEATVQVAITWQRAGVWEGPRVQATLTNGNGSNNTSGLTIRLHDDGTAGHDNYVEMDSSEVGGDVPALAEIHLKNTSGSGRNFRNFYIATNPYAATLAHIIEGEARDAGYGSVGAAASASNGQYLQLTINTVLSVPWTLSAATLLKTQGRTMRLLAKFLTFDSAANIYVTPKIADHSGLIILAQGTEVRLTTGQNFIQDLGALPIPPGGFNTNYAAQKLILTFRTETAQTVNLDFSQLTPVAPTGCLCQVAQLGNLVLNNEEIVIDTIEETIYHTESGANHPLYQAKVAPLWLWPGKAQRIYVLADGVDVTLDDTMAVQVFFRERRMTI